MRKTESSPATTPDESALAAPACTTSVLLVTSTPSKLRASARIASRPTPPPKSSTKATESGFASHAALVLDFGGGVGRDALRALARSLLGVEVTSDPEAVRAAAAGALSSGVVAADDAVFLNDLLNLPQPSELRPIYEAMDTGTRNRGQLDLVARILDRKSRQRPRLLVVEDLHWADQLVLMQLARLTTVMAQFPALLIMTSRIEGDPLDATWRAQVSGFRADDDRSWPSALGRCPRSCRGADRGEYGFR